MSAAHRFGRNTVPNRLFKIPPCRGLVVFLLEETEPEGRAAAVHWLAQLPYIPSVFLLIGFHESRVLSTLRVDGLHSAFEDDGHRRIVGAIRPTFA
jgi:hypothetical protein